MKDGLPSWIKTSLCR